nr:uncharacterized protein LOC117221242 [Megalopta genalis]
MKSVLLICSLLVVAAVVRGDLDEVEQKLFEVIKDDFVPCAGEAGLSIPGDAGPVSKSDMSPEDIGKLYCTYACIMKRREIMVDGQIVADKMIELVSQTFPEKVEEMGKGIETCVEEVKDAGDECVVMEKFGNCMDKM